MGYLLDVQDVRVKYPLREGGVKTVLGGVNLRVEDGEFVTVVGPTGCGKTTLLRLILGQESPTSGVVLLNDHAITGVNQERGVVFQRYGLFPHISVLDNIAVGPVLAQTTLPQRLFFTPAYRRKRKEYRELARKYVLRIGLSESDFDKYPYELSGGMQQRVAIAQAVMMRPRVLLMDEPFGALDDNTRSVMQLLILEEWQQCKMTVYFVTHDLEEAVFLGTRVIGLTQHWLNADGSSAEGAVIVLDKEIAGGHPKPTDFKYSPMANELIKTIRDRVLDSTSRRKIEEFDLTHKDAWRPRSKADGCI